MFSSELREKAQELIGRYPVSRSALLPLLHLVQSQDGYLSDDGIAECAGLLGLTKAEVAAVATFYTMFKRQPMGKHLVSVCTNFSCKVRGAQDVYERLVDKLGVGHNETTADGTFTLEHAECLGNCEGAPIVSIDYYNYECMTPEGAEQLLDRVAAGDMPEPTRGLRSPGIRQISHRLAGVGPHPDDIQRGERLGYARSAAGGTPPPATADVGPQAELGLVSPEFRAEGSLGRSVGERSETTKFPQERESDFSHERERQREAVKDDVRAAGQQPDQVEDQAGPDAREFPSRDPDIEPDDDSNKDGHG